MSVGYVSAVRTAAEQVHEVAALLAEIDFELVPPSEFSDLARALASLRNQVDGADALVIGRANRSGQYSVDGARTISAWVRSRSNSSSPAASGRVSIAKLLEIAPTMAAEHRAGRITAHHMGLAARAAKKTELRWVSFPEFEAYFADIAGRFTPTDFQIALDYWGALVDGQSDAEDQADRAEKAYLHVSETKDGMVRVDGLLDPETGAAFLAALEALCDYLQRHPSEDDDAAASEDEGEQLDLDDIVVYRGDAESDVATDAKADDAADQARPGEQAPARETETSEATPTAQPEPDAESTVDTEPEAEPVPGADPGPESMPETPESEPTADSSAAMDSGTEAAGDRADTTVADVVVIPAPREGEPGWDPFQDPEYLRANPFASRDSGCELDDDPPKRRRHQTVDLEQEPEPGSDPPDSPGRRRRRKRSQRNVDALRWMLAAILRDPTMPNAVGGLPVQLIAVATVETLKAALTDTGVEPGELNGTTVPAATIRRNACEAGILPMVMNSDGVPIDLGRLVRVVTKAQRLAVIFRDMYCRFPDCENRIEHIHHIVFWALGGPSDLPNLVGLCNSHHHSVHERGFVLTGNGNAVTTVHDKNGNPIGTTKPRRAGSRTPTRKWLRD